MGNYFENLGNLLNEALENGEIPQKKENTSEFSQEQNEINKNQRENTRENTSDSSLDFENYVNSQKNKEKINEKTSESREKVYFKKKIFEKEEKNTGEILKNGANNSKMYNYALFMHKTPEFTKALSTLDIVYPFTQEELNRKYHYLLKASHPDTCESTIQNKESVYKNRQITQINDLQWAYAYLKPFCVEKK